MIDIGYAMDKLGKRRSASVKMSSTVTTVITMLKPKKSIAAPTSGATMNASDNAVPKKDVAE